MVTAVWALNSRLLQTTVCLVKKKEQIISLRLNADTAASAVQYLPELSVKDVVEETSAPEPCPKTHHQWSSWPSRCAVWWWDQWHPRGCRGHWPLWRLPWGPEKGRWQLHQTPEKIHTYTRFNIIFAASAVVWHWGNDTAVREPWATARKDPVRFTSTLFSM